MSTWTEDTLFNVTGARFLPSQIAAINAAGLGNIPSTTNVIPTNTQTPTNTNNAPSVGMTDWLSSVFGSIFGNEGGNPQTLNPLKFAGYAGLGYGLYKIYRTKRLSLGNVALVAGSLWLSGLIPAIMNSLPKNNDGSINTLATIGSMLPGSIGSITRTALPAIAAGGTLSLGSILLPIALGFIGNKLFKKPTYRRRYYRPTRRYFYARRSSYKVR